MTSLEEAQAQILALAQPLAGAEELPLAQALGRVLARDYSAEWDVPPAANSAMDGFVLRWADGRGPLAISQRIAAGQAPSPLVPGTAARIFTGGEIPAGADTVVMQENTEILEGGLVRLLKAPRLGENIRPQGQDITRGQQLLARGCRLGPVALGLAASQGWSQLSVTPVLAVALINSGDELAAPGQALAPGQIYNSNGTCLASLLMALGCRCESFTLGDSLAASQALFTELAERFPLIICTGGVSAGEEDHVKAALAKVGEVALWKLAIKPGKPMLMGRIGQAQVFGLPGNPVSALITFLLFAKPFIERLQGGSGSLPAPYRMALAAAKPMGGGQRTEFLRVQRQGDVLVPFANQSSGVLSSMTWAHGLAKLPPGEATAPGGLVDYWPLAELLAPR